MSYSKTWTQFSEARSAATLITNLKFQSGWLGLPTALVSSCSITGPVFARQSLKL